MEVISIAQTSAGRPLFGINAAPPVDQHGNPDLTDELFDALRSCFKGTDNVNVQFVTRDLPPTSMIAVSSELEVADDDVAFVYEARAMLYEASNGRVASNMKIRFARRDVMRFADGSAVSQPASDQSWFHHLMLCNSIEESRDGLTNFLRAVHIEIRRRDRANVTQISQSKRGWKIARALRHLVGGSRVET